MQEQEEPWLTWDNRPDGAYLKVRTDIDPISFPLERIRDTLIGDRVMNFQLGPIVEAIKAAQGEWVRIGNPFFRFDDEKLRHVFLNVTAWQVRLAIRSTILTSPLVITRADIEFVLQEKGIVYGVDWDTIDYLLTTGVYDQETIIASADIPVNGTDAEIREIIPIDPDARPVIQVDGSVDYRNLENIRKVAASDIICVRVPPTEGIPGRSVFGKHLPPVPGKDLNLPAGENTILDSNATQLRAATAGYLYRRAGLIHVGNLYVVKGDISFKTGNIDYCGDVLVRGNVLADFKVIADGQVTIEGLVESSEIISRNGNVIIRDGVFGKGKATVSAAKDVLLGMAQECTIKAGGEVKVQKYMRSCQVECRSLMAAYSSCVVSSCTIRFLDKVSFSQLGSLGGSPNELVLVDTETEKFQAQAEELEANCATIRKIVQDLEMKLRLMKLQIKNPDQANPELKGQYQLLGTQLSGNQKKWELMDAKRRKLLQYLDVPPDRLDLITVDRLEPVLLVRAFGQERSFKQELDKVKIIWKDGALQMVSRR